MERLDVFLTKNGFFNSRARSQMEILSGNVKVNGVVITSNKAQVCESDEIIISDNISLLTFARFAPIIIEHLNNAPVLYL